jgi:hypothetical protein
MIDCNVTYVVYVLWHIHIACLIFTVSNFVNLVNSDQEEGSEEHRREGRYNAVNRSSVKSSLYHTSDLGVSFVRIVIPYLSIIIN